MWGLGSGRHVCLDADGAGEDAVCIYEKFRRKMGLIQEACE